MNLTDLEHITAISAALANGTDTYLVIPGEPSPLSSGGHRPLDPPADWVKLTQPCDTCTFKMACHWPNCPHGDQCCHVKTLAVGTVHQLLPVRDRPSGPESGDGPMVYHFGSCYWLWHDKDHYEAIRLHRDPTVNDYIAHITRINKPC
jgi:hypothetical protein